MSDSGRENVFGTICGTCLDQTCASYSTGSTTVLAVEGLDTDTRFLKWVHVPDVQWLQEMRAVHLRPKFSGTLFLHTCWDQKWKRQPGSLTGISLASKCPYSACIHHLDQTHTRDQSLGTYTRPITWYMSVPLCPV